MTEARRTEDLNRERQMLATGLNIGGQVLGTALSASGGGAAAGAVAPATGAASQFVQSGNVRPSATPLPVAQYAQPVSQVSPQPMVAPTGPVTMSQPQPNFIANQVQPQQVQMVQAPMVAAPMPAAVDQAINAPMQNGAPMPTNNQIASELYDEAIRVNQPRSQAGARRARRPR